MKYYYRIFYCIYSFSLKTNAFYDNRPISALISSFLFSFFLVMDLAILETSLKYLGIDVRQLYSRMVFDIVSGCILVANLFLFLYKKRYLKIEERFKEESNKKRKIRNFFCAIYCILSYIGVVILGCFFGNPWIK